MKQQKNTSDSSPDSIPYKRGKRDTTATSERMTWESRCGRFRVQESKGLFDKVTRYYALILKEEEWRMLEHLHSYRTRRAAEKALLNHLKNLTIIESMV